MAQLSSIALIIVVNVLICVLAEELYSDRYDYVDLQNVLENKNTREEYYNCFMEIAPCKTPEQIALTGIFAEAFQTKCRKCTKKQIENLDFAANWFVKNEPEKWKLIVAKTIEIMKRKSAE